VVEKRAFAFSLHSVHWLDYSLGSTIVPSALTVSPRFSRGFSEPYLGATLSVLERGEFWKRSFRASIAVPQTGRG